jgi:hypothetical protein
MLPSFYTCPLIFTALADPCFHTFLYLCFQYLCEGTQLSSLPLQMLVYFEYYWLYFFFALEILSYIYKGIALPYPSRYVGTDIPLLVLLCLSDFARLYIGMPR